jgi:hypothetical protein
MGVAEKREVTGSRVEAAGVVVKKGEKTGGCVVEAGSVGEERITANSCISTCCIVSERRCTDTGVETKVGAATRRKSVKGMKTNSRVVETGGEAKKGLVTLRGVHTGIASVRRRCRELPESIRGGRKPKADEQERDENETAPMRRSVN